MLPTAEGRPRKRGTLHKENVGEVKRTTPTPRPVATRPTISLELILDDGLGPSEVQLNSCSIWITIERLWTKKSIGSPETTGLLFFCNW